jgi:hypothetical protein
MLRTVVVLTALLATLTFVAEARADHTTAPAGRDEITLDGPAGSSLDLSLRLGVGGFRLGGRLLGPGGFTGGAWLNGEARREGFRLEGRVEHGGKSHGFTFDADLGEWLGRARRAWDVTDL